MRRDFDYWLSDPTIENLSKATRTRMRKSLGLKDPITPERVRDWLNSLKENEEAFLLRTNGIGSQTLREMKAWLRTHECMSNQDIKAEERLKRWRGASKEELVERLKELWARQNYLAEQMTVIVKTPSVGPFPGVIIGLGAFDSKLKAELNRNEKELLELIESLDKWHNSQDTGLKINKKSTLD